MVDASNIEVTVSNGEVTLTGTVDSRAAKRRAEDRAESVSGVCNVQNNLRIERAEGGAQKTEPEASTNLVSSSARVNK